MQRSVYRIFSPSTLFSTQFITRNQSTASAAKNWSKFTRHKMASPDPGEGGGTAQPKAPQPQGNKMQGKRPYHNSHGHGHGRKPTKMRKKEKPVQEGTHEEVLLADVQALLAAQ
jgi:hypothetical protein